MTVDEIKDELYRLLSDCVNNGYPLRNNYQKDRYREAVKAAVNALDQDHFTDKEQRIFLAAMGREEKICKEVDKSCPCREPYKDTLVSVCRSIERKVKNVLFD